METPQDAKQAPAQSQLVYFKPDRRILGWVTIFKRVMFVFTASSIIDANIYLTLGLLGLRELLSAYTDYATPNNPVSSVQQTSPPNPIVTAPVDPNVIPATDYPHIDALEKS